MSDTKEKIMCASLKLFAADGYEAVSVSMIAKKVGITKGALYRHFQSKSHIFESVVKRMEDMDTERAGEFHMPEYTYGETPEVYKNTSLEAVRVYSKEQLRYWTVDDFASDFRRMLTLEQYRSPEMMRLYQQYFAGGPLEYMTDVFAATCVDKTDAKAWALDFYGSFFLFFSLYDAAENENEKIEVLHAADRHIDSFIDRLSAKKSQ